MSINYSSKPFVFKTQHSLVLLTGLKASDAKELRDGLEKAPEMSVYYHTHHFLERHQFLVQEPPNDFAYWVTHVLNEIKIGERLAAVDTVRFRSLEELRQALLSALHPLADDKNVLRKAPAGHEFYFMKSMLFSVQTPHSVRTLEEFLEGLKKVSIHSLYFHIFEARLRTLQQMNDFSYWLTDLGEKALAKEIERLDPYSQTMEDLRTRIIRLIEKRIQQESYATTR